MKHVRWIMAAAVLAVFLLPGCQWDSRPLHERIAEGMFHAQNDPQWEYVTGKYGEEDFTLNTEDYVGGIYSSRFDIWMKLYWDEEEKTYRDSYAVYLRQGELIALLDEAFGEILGEDDCRIYALPYLWCPSGFGRDTTARELLEASEITDDILVQTAVFTAKDPAGREADWQAVREAAPGGEYADQVGGGEEKQRQQDPQHPAERSFLFHESIPLPCLLSQWHHYTKFFRKRQPRPGRQKNCLRRGRNVVYCLRCLH